MAMNKEKASGIIVLVIICCVFMALIETIIEPAYIVKSALKVAVFLLLPLVYAKITHTKLPRKIAYIFSSGMFAVYHIAMIGMSFPPLMLLLALIGLAIGGLLFDYVDSKNENIYHSWVIHMFADFAIMTIWYLYI